MAATIADIQRGLQQVLGYVRFMREQSSRPRAALDISRARAEFGYEPNQSAHDGRKRDQFHVHDIYKGMQDRKLTDLDIRRKEIELSRDQRQFARESAEELAQRMHFQGMEQLAELTDNEVVALKILLSIYRRSRDLSKIEEQGRIRF